MTAIGMYLIASGLAIGAGSVAHWLMVRATVRAMIFANLDSAYQNGYFEEGQQFWGSGPHEIALDLTAYASDCEGRNPDTLAPHVRAWLYSKGIRT